MAGFAKNLLSWTGARLGLSGGPAAEMPALPVLPTAPVDESAAPLANRQKKRRAMSAPARNGTMLTGPSGVAAPAPTRKSLLGL